MNFNNKHTLIFAIHRTVSWWHFLGKNLGCASSTVLTDLRGEGDISVVDDFYNELKRMRKRPDPAFTLLTETQVADVIARCRVLRWLEPDLARAMIEAMAFSLDRVLDRLNPDVVLSLPIDRYPTDVLDRLAQARGIPYVQLTASIFPGMSMLLQRGKLLLSDFEPPSDLLREKLNELTAPSFVPSYVPKKSTYTTAKFVRTLGYFQLRALAFKAISYIKRDPLNLHYLDAQPNLGHKCRWRDIRVVRFASTDWQDKLRSFPQDKRVLFGLQLFPEASIDYWIDSVELIDHESLIVDAVTAFSRAGFLVLVKDHPLQFGFRQAELLERLLALPNVVIVPYDVPGNKLLEMVDINFTCTGTLGMQAALMGKTSVVTDSYYTNEKDFILFRNREEVHGLPARVMADRQQMVNLEKRHERIVCQVLQGSFDGDLFSFKNFDPSKPAQAALQLGQALGKRLAELIASPNDAS